MKKLSVKNLVLTAIFAALTFAATMIIQIPIPATGGYLNLGDCLVLMSGFVLGPYLGAFAAGLGSAIADLVAFPLYAPATFIIKALMAMVSGLVFSFSKKNSLWILISGIIGETIMVVGYYVFEAFILGMGWGVAAAGIGPNIFQAIAGIGAASFLIQAFIRKKRKPSDEDISDYEDYDE